MISTVTNSFSTLRDLNRAAVGCPSMLIPTTLIAGSWSRPFAKDYREHGSQLIR